MPEKKVRRTELKNSGRMLKVLMILKQRSDTEHSLTQSQIMKYLAGDPDGDYSCSPKTLSATIHELVEMVNPKIRTADNEDYFVIRYQGWEKGIPDKITDIYYMPVIKTDEVQSFAEGILRLDTLGKADKEKLIKKLESEYRLDSKGIVDVSVFSVDNIGNINENTDIITEAIAKERQITFHFCGYDCNGNLQPVKSKNGSPKLYTVNPYYVVGWGGKRYMLCNTVPYDDASIYRIDLMQDIKISEQTRRMINEINEFVQSKDPQRFMEKHVNMMYGQPITVMLKVNVNFYTLIHDMFGSSWELVRHIDSQFDEIKVQASEKGVLDIAMTAPDKIEIIRPFKFRDKLAERAKELSEKYGGK